MNARQQRVLSTLPATIRAEVALTFERKPKHFAAIRAYCLMCKQGSKAEIIACQDDVCPLLHVRPHKSEEAKQESSACL